MAGKKAGNFSDSAVFCENLSRKRLRFQVFARHEQGINSRAQGINSAFWTGAGNLARKRSAGKFISAMDKKIINQAIRWRSTKTCHPREREDPGRHDLVWLAISAPLSGSRRRLIVAPQLDTRFRGYDTCCLGRPWG